MNLVATLPKDRTQPGTLTACVNGVQLGSWPCLGKSDNAKAAEQGNRARNPVLPYGDTPTGIYRAQAGGKMADSGTYGIYPVIWLWGTAGDAGIAYSRRYPDGRAKPARSGIWLHGGTLRAGQLRPTFGCLRVADETMAKLHALARIHGPITQLEVQEI